MSAVRGASALLAIKRASIHDASTLLSAERVHVRDAAGLKLVFSSMSVSASPASVKGYGNVGGPVDITTPDCTVAVTGGVAPFTYLWTRTDAGSDSWIITTDNAATTAFTAEAVEGGSYATFICTVTDDTGTTAATAEVGAQAINLGGGI